MEHVTIDIDRERRNIRTLTAGRQLLLGILAPWCFVVGLMAILVVGALAIEGVSRIDAEPPAWLVALLVLAGVVTFVVQTKHVLGTPARVASAKAKREAAQHVRARLLQAPDFSFSWTIVGFVIGVFSVFGCV